MTPEFITTLSKKSAYKYRNTRNYNDLVSEGILAAYEELDSNPSASEKRLYQVVNWAQWKFLNVDSLAVHIPENLVRLVKGMGSEGVETNYTKESLDWAKVVLSQGQFRAEYHGIDLESDQEESFSKEDLLEKIWKSAMECLSEEEYELFWKTHFLGVDGKSISDSLGVSKQAVNKRVKKINEKVRKRVVNKKWEL